MQQEKTFLFHFQGKEYAINSINADSSCCKLTTILPSGCTVDRAWWATVHGITKSDMTEAT